MEFIQNFLSIGLAGKGLEKNVMYQKFTRLTNEKYETYHIYRNCRKAIAYYVLSFSNILFIVYFSGSLSFLDFYFVRLC